VCNNRFSNSQLPSCFAYNVTGERRLVSLMRGQVGRYYLGLTTGFAGGSGRDGVLARGFLTAGSGAGFVSFSLLPSAVLLSSVALVSLNCFFQRGVS